MLPWRNASRYEKYLTMPTARLALPAKMPEREKLNECHQGQAGQKPATTQRTADQGTGRPNHGAPHRRGDPAIPGVELRGCQRRPDRRDGAHFETNFLRPLRF